MTYNVLSSGTKHYIHGGETMFTVGEFSKICQVTIKTLHYYDRIGLLQPSKVDKFTGYRYYDNTQLDKMLLIQRLKRYGFSLEEKAQLIECQDAELLMPTKQTETANAAYPTDNQGAGRAFAKL